MNDLAAQDKSNAGDRPARVNLSDVRRSFNRKVANHFTVSWFGRPLANLATPIFYNSGWSANQVTLLRIVIALVLGKAGKAKSMADAAVR